MKLERRLRPLNTDRPAFRDAGGAVIVLLVTGILYVGAVDQSRHFSDVFGSIFSFYLLPSMAMLLAMRAGSIDLSVWALAGLGGVVAAALVNAGMEPAGALAAAAGAGLACGAINALAIARFGLPSPVFTLLLGTVVMATTGTLVGDRQIDVDYRIFTDWAYRLLPPLPTEDGDPALSGGVVTILRVSIAMGAFLATMLVTTVAPALRRKLSSPRLELAAAHLAGGLLAGLGGAIWIIDSASAPVLTWPVGDLRIPAAAVLAGGLYFGPTGRTPLSLLALLAALLAATLWRQQAPNIVIGVWHGQMLLLVLLVLVAQRALLAWERKMPLGAVAAVLALVGLTAITAGVRLDGRSAGRGLLWAGLAVWLAGAAALLIGCAKKRGEPEGPPRVS
jgi:ribose/xylose/arabinose/galactoside ABC-type transport system permease subunit